MADDTDLSEVLPPELAESERIIRELTGLCMGCGTSACPGCWCPPLGQEVELPQIPAKQVKPRHGTWQRYRRGCRCERCRAANTRGHRERRRVRQEAAQADPSRVPHGVGGYQNWGCRCPVCKAAGSEANLRNRLRRNARAANSGASDLKEKDHG